MRKFYIESLWEKERYAIKDKCTFKADLWEIGASYTPKEMEAMLTELGAWLEENATGYVYADARELFYTFEKEEDALLFKLTWG